MRNANEMYQFCLDNGYGQGFNTRNSIKHFEIIEKNLGNDENVLFAFIGLHNYVSISKHDNNFAYAVTNKRILLGQKKVIGEVFQSIALNKINDITFQSGVAYGVITVDAQTEVFNVAVLKSQANNINKKLHELLYQLKEESSTVVSSSSAADEIRKFKELLDDGIISQEEFDKKKSELLS
jgi:hypothetical protein